ncbi:uncharacterized protein [Euwallacea similis]|uniref:uncharacterized protein n=1 Tax=Euwallacea similis TaxID=1736056 RepID=UPI003450B662
MKNYQLNPVNPSKQTMKLAILFALVACASAVPPTDRNVVVSTPEKVVVVAETYNVPQQKGFAHFGQYSGNQFGSQGDNIYQVAQYIAYQFKYAQQQGYTAAEFSEYLLQQGFPHVVAEYLSKQYEAGESEPYFQSPYQIFQYYYTQGVNEETLQYLTQQITKAFKLFQNFLAQNGQKVSEQKFPGVPHTISQYVLEQGKYYNENAVTYLVAQHAYQQLQQAQQYAQNALEYFTNGQISQEAYRYLFEQLQQGIHYIRNIQVYHNYQQNYLPYYAAQYYTLQAQEAYQFFQNAYQFIQEETQSVFPQSFVQQVQYAYFTARKAYQTFQQKEIVSSALYENQYQGYSGIYQYVQNLLHYIQLQLSQGKISQEFANYMSQQLRFIQQFPYGSQHSIQQVQEYFQKILQFVKHQNEIPQYVEQYINQQVQYALQVLQNYYQGYQYYGKYYPKSGSGFFQSLYQKYFDKNNQYSGYQYGPYQSQAYGNQYVHSGPFVSGYQYGRSYVPSGNLHGYQYGPSVYQWEYVPTSHYYGYQHGPSHFEYTSYPYQYQSGSHMPSATFQNSYPYQYSQVSSIPQGSDRLLVLYCRRRAMKSVILLALVAAAAAVPFPTKPLEVSRPAVVGGNIPSTYGFFGQQYGSEGNIFYVAQYIAYQFNHFQQLGYTPAQVSQYLLEQGYPQYVANYFSQQYETGLNLPYFQAPYLIFQYFYQNGVPQEIEQYVVQKISHVHQLFQNYYSQHGQQAYSQVFSGVPTPFSQFITEFGKYYNQNGVTYSSATYAYQQLVLVEQYIQKVFQYFQTENVNQQIYQYVYQQLELALESIQIAKEVYQSYQSYHHNYIPYYAVQYYGQQTHQIYQYLQNVFQYIQEYQSVFPQYVFEQVQMAYTTALTAFKTYQNYQPSHYTFGQEHQYGSTYEYKYVLKQVYQYTQYFLQYLHQQVNQGVISQEYASYIFQQLELILQVTQPGYQYNSGYQTVFQQIFQYYHNILRYIQGNSSSTVSQYFIQYFIQHLQYVLQILQGGQYPSSYFGGYFSKYLNKFYGQGSYTPYYSYGPYSTSSYESGSYTPYYNSKFYGNYGPYSQDYSYNGPYSSSHYYGSFFPNTYYGSYTPYKYQSYGTYGYSGMKDQSYMHPYVFGSFSTSGKIAAAAA